MIFYDHVTYHLLNNYIHNLDLIYLLHNLLNAYRNLIDYYYLVIHIIMLQI